MSEDTLLHKMLGQVASEQAAQRATPPSPGEGGVPVSGPQRHIRSLRAGRFDRWHVESAPPVDEDIWFFSYLDLITVLMVMLVVMLAFSDPVSQKLRDERKEMTPGSAAAVVQSVTGSGSTIVPPIELPHPAQVPPAKDGDTQEEGRQPSQSPTRLELPIGDLGQNVEVVVGEGVVRFRISSEILFGSGDSSLTPAGQAVMDRLLPAFNQAQDHTIVVEGHTDNVPIRTVRFPSNWELAASRAGSVVRHLEARGLNPTRLRATGYADTRPLAPNATAEGRSTNRRVEIAMEAPPTALR